MKDKCLQKTTTGEWLVEVVYFAGQRLEILPERREDVSNCQNEYNRILLRIKCVFTGSLVCFLNRASRDVHKWQVGILENAGGEWAGRWSTGKSLRWLGMGETE